MREDIAQTIKGKRVARISAQIHHRRMPVWIKNGLSIPEWGVVQFRLLVLQHETRKQMAMLFRAGEKGKPDDVFVALPDDELAARFPDFTTIAETDIPDGVTLLVDGGSGFAERFPSIALKLRGMPTT